jgi:hypothetical protein
LEVDVQQGNFKILQLLPQVLILFLVEKWILPSKSEIAKIGQKTQGILGVKARRACARANEVEGEKKGRGSQAKMRHPRRGG